MVFHASRREHLQHPALQSRVRWFGDRPLSLQTDSRGGNDMFSAALRLGFGVTASFAMVGLGGCASMQASDGSAAADGSSQAQVQMASVNQGRFPAPTYPLVVEPPYALTGEQASVQAHDWVSADRR